MGFSIVRVISLLIFVGKGVFVIKGLVLKGAVVFMYFGNGIISILLRVFYIDKYKFNKIFCFVIFGIRGWIGNLGFYRFLNFDLEINCKLFYVLGSILEYLLG